MSEGQRRFTMGRHVDLFLGDPTAVDQQLHGLPPIRRSAEMPEGDLERDGASDGGQRVREFAAP